MPKKKIVVLVLLPLVVALHVYLVWLGDGWRIFALVEAGFGAFLALILRDANKLGG